MNKNRNITKTMAIVTAGIVAVQSFGAVSFAAEETALTKEETVYVKTDPSGAQQEVIVSDWLKNINGQDSLSDHSFLSNIENVKGDETFSQDGENLVWSAQGNDIYYQGTTDKKLPVSICVTYYLDGKEITAQELEGKSGHIKIHYQFENHEKTENVYIPFMMVTGAVLPQDTFSNVSVKNGRAFSDGERNIVIGIGMPGMAESLKLEETEMLKDIEIPDSFELEADVTDYQQNMFLTVATPLDLSQLGIDDVKDLDDLKDSLKKLEDASEQLVDGSGDLADGIQTLKDSCQELIDGMTAVDENMGTLADGISTLDEKKGALISGINALADGLQTLESKKGTLISGVNTLAKGGSDLASGAEKVDAGAKSLSQNVQKLAAGADQLANSEGSAALSAGAEALTEGTSALASGSETLAAGTASLQQGNEALLAGTSALKEGLTEAEGLQAGSSALEEGSENLSAGVTAFVDGVDQLLPLAQGAGTYAQGVGSYVDQVNALLETLNSTEQPLELQTEGESFTVTTIDAQALADMQSVLAQLQSVQATVQGASKADLIKLYASYDSYVAQLNDCISLLSSAIGGVQEQTIDTNTTGTEKGTAAVPQEQLEVLKQAGIQLKENGAQLQLEDPSQLTVLQESGVQLKNGATALQSGAHKVNNGVKEISQNVEILEESMQQAAAGAKTLNEGAQSLKTNAKALDEGAKTLQGGIAQAMNGASSLSENTALLADGAKELFRGTSDLKDGAFALQNGLKQLEGGTGELSSGIGQLSAGGEALRSGAGALSTGIGQLADGSSQLKAGTAKLADGGSKLDSGVNELKEGADDLKEGMEKFKEEGIDGITDFLDEDVQEVIDRLLEVKDAGDNYGLFSSTQSGEEDEVKFIIETGTLE